MAAYRVGAAPTAKRPGQPNRPGAHPARFNTRALVGGLLVSASVVGLLLAYQSAQGGDATAWVIARRSIPAGATIMLDDLALAHGNLPDQVDAGLFADHRDVVGSVARAPIGRDQLIARSNVAEPAAITGPNRRVSLELPSAAALGGRLNAGEPVDVVAVRDGESPAHLVAEGAEVVSVSAPGETEFSSAGSDRLLVTLITEDADEATAVLDSHANGGVTLIAPAERG